MQRALIQYRKPENYKLVREALEKAGRRDLIGYTKHCLIRPVPPRPGETSAGGGHGTGKKGGKAHGGAGGAGKGSKGSKGYGGMSRAQNTPVTIARHRAARVQRRRQAQLARRGGMPPLAAHTPPPMKCRSAGAS